jgi:hypothetical protein
MENIKKQDLTPLAFFQSATGSQRYRDPLFTAYAFTEHGAIMAANVLKAEQKPS